jgi:hypothetical protein
MELLPASGQPVDESEFGMFDMVAGRIAKMLGRPKQPAKETPAQAVARAQKLATLKGRLGYTYQLKIMGDFDALTVIDCCLSIGLKRDADAFIWFGGSMAHPKFRVKPEQGSVAPGASGKVRNLVFSFQPARVYQPKKVLERMTTCMNYFIKRMGGAVVDQLGKKPGTQVLRGEDMNLLKALKDLETAGLKPGQPVTVRLV